MNDNPNKLISDNSNLLAKYIMGSRKHSSRVYTSRSIACRDTEYLAVEKHSIIKEWLQFAVPAAGYT